MKFIIKNYLIKANIIRIFTYFSKELNVFLTKSFFTVICILFFYKTYIYKKQALGVMKEGQIEKKSQFFEKGKWQEEKNLHQVRNLKDWQLQSLQIYETDRELILKDIEHISFEQLKVFRVCNVGLVSIESIRGVYCPQLDTFSISNNRNIQDYPNHVVFVKELRKVSWNKLTRLALYSNHLNDAQQLSQCFFPKLKSLFIDYTPLPESHIDDPTVLFKFFPSQLDQLQIHGIRPNIVQMKNFFKKKWVKTNLRTEI